MDSMKIKLAALWTATMLTYLLGDVIRIFSGDFSAGMLEGMEASDGMYLGVAALMLLPVIMVVLQFFLKYAALRWTNIVLSAFFFVFNAIGLPTYPSAYDKFLLAVSMVFNLVVIWLAWRWKPAESN